MDNANAPVVEVCGVTKAFGSGEARVQALRGVDLVLKRGEFVSIMGASGSGKSTLLHLIGALDACDSGTITVAGSDLAKLDDDGLTLLRRRSIGFVFQAFNLLDVLTAAENVAVPLLIEGEAETDANDKAVQALQRVGLAHRQGHRPSELSGGEQQRVAIARALVAAPVLLLADEPTGNLDSGSGDQIMTLLRNLVDQNQQTILMVTHNPAHAEMADRLVVLRDGQVLEQRPLRPRSSP
jgi:putative ABC transport system ATP-binding protein